MFAKSFSEHNINFYTIISPEAGESTFQRLMPTLDGKSFDTLTNKENPMIKKNPITLHLTIVKNL